MVRLCSIGLSASRRMRGSRRIPLGVAFVGKRWLVRFCTDALRCEEFFKGLTNHDGEYPLYRYHRLSG